MSYYIGLPLVILLAVAEAAVLPLFRVAGLQPDLVLVLLVAWLMLRGPTEAFVLIPVAGISIGLVDGAPLGTALLALAPLVILQEIRGARLSETSLVLTIVFTVALTLTYNLTYLVVYTVAGQSGDWLTATARVIVPTTLLNVAILLPAYAILSMSSHEMRRPTYV